MEYHDPSGLFSLISRDIAARLPLRNLNWQSTTRPLRQIKSLHLEFVPDNFTKDTLRPPVPRVDSDGATSFDIVRSGVDPRRNALRERRHQIPGLQTSPYLKIYILRSDDKDTYKATERQKVREWIRDNAATAKGKGKGENHDAFEWMIIHVVIPDTTAASEPRWRESSQKDSDELKERKQGMKLPGKSTRTVFDKLRADFNESGKNGQDRVAQIRLARDQMPPELLPTPAVATTIEETNDEREKGWHDIMSKFKSFVLGPFDLRVRQYEADVAEQESRRSMPGFNFCTFFIHKEGLAIALESIGLVEDALVIYDELSLGLETVLRDIARGKADGTATTFGPYTDDIKERIVGMRKAQPNGVATARHVPSRDAETLEKDYREKIVRSDISVFDFFSYLFSRQKALILRIANAKSVHTFATDGSEDLVLISEVCWRAMTFIHNNARTLRRDLSAFRHAQWQKQVESTLTKADVKSIVCSWTYTVARQILEETSSSSVDQFCSDLGKRDSLANGNIADQKRFDYLNLSGGTAHPHRTTSLPPRKSRISELQGRTSLQSASESDLISPPLGSIDDKAISGGLAAGLLELVTYRAELVMMQRKMLELLAEQRGWFAGWALVKDKSGGHMEEVDLNGDADPSKVDNKSTLQPQASNLLTPTLASELKSTESFLETYELLSNQAMRYFVAATQTKSAELIMGDLAILKSQQGDYGYAVSYFQHVLPLYATDGWSLMEDEALKMHATCLKELDRKEEYVSTVLSLLAKACGRIKAQQLLNRKDRSFDELIDVERVLPELVTFSGSLAEDVTNPAEQFFGNIQLDQELRHHDDKDVFIMRLRLRHLLDDDVEFDRIAARLVHIDDTTQEVSLKNIGPRILKHGLNEVELESSTVAFGPYSVDRIVLQAKKLVFVHEVLPRPEFEQTPLGITDLTTPDMPSDAHKRPWVFLYPAQHAFSAEVSVGKDIHVDKPRQLKIELSSGWNPIDAIDLKLKPTSAGLRIHLADASFERIKPRPDADTKPGQISLSSLGTHESALVTVPYTLEQATPEISLRMEALYHTQNGAFSLPSSIKLANELPLDVDVNDIFHLDKLFSNFTIRTTRGSPLAVTNAQLDPSAVYHVEGPPALPMPMTIFEKQPMKLIYKITRKSFFDAPVSKKSAALALGLHYHSITELILFTWRRSFKEAIDSSPFASLSRLLLPLLCERAKQLTSQAEAEMAVLIGEARIPYYEDVGWTEVITTLPTAVQQELTDWLKSWHEQNRHVTLEDDAIPPELQRSITIAVDVPQVDFVHSASLSMLNLDGHFSGSDPVIVVLGQPIKVQLTITNARNWSADAIFHSKRKDDDKGHESAVDFTYDIHMNPDCWLVGGQRRGHFKAKDGDELTFELLLIPLRLGCHPLPSVEVQAEPASTNANDSNKPQESSAVSCETHYENAGQIVQVIRGLTTSRVHVPESPSNVRPSSRPNTATAATSKEAG